MPARRVLAAALAALALAGPAAAVAQEATPAGGADLFAGLGLPEIAVTVTESGYEVAPAEVPAGRYLVTVSAEGIEGDAFASFVRLSEGRTVDDLTAADEIAAGTPIPEEGFAPESYAWLYETYIAGGPSTVNEAARQAVIDLPAGDYGIWGEDPMAAVPAGELTVTGDPEARIEGPEPEAAVTVVELGEGGAGYEFDVQGEFRAGPQVVKVVNASDQPHFMDASQHPEPFTIEDFMAAAMAFDPTGGATPAPDALDFERFTYAGWAGVQSIGTTQWVVIDAAPGQILLACFIPDPLAEGTPHAFEGMLQLFPVAGA